MGWVTLDDGQHVFIGSGGKVLATRSAITATAGGRERMGAMRSKAQEAVHKALQRSHGKTAATAQQSPATTRAIEHAKAAGPTPKTPDDSKMRAVHAELVKKGSKLSFDEFKQKVAEAKTAQAIAKNPGTLREQADRARAAKGPAEERAKKLADKSGYISATQSQRLNRARLDPAAAALKGRDYGGRMSRSDQNYALQKIQSRETSAAGRSLVLRQYKTLKAAKTAHEKSLRLAPQA